MNGAVLVGAENFYVCVAQAIEEFFARMAVRVLRSGGNNREFRVDGGEKLGRRRIFTAMMADLQDVRIEGLTGALRKYGRLRLRLGVAGEKKAAAVELKPHDERIVVLGGCSDITGICFWPEDFTIRTV